MSVSELDVGLKVRNGYLLTVLKHPLEAGILEKPTTTGGLEEVLGTLEGEKVLEEATYLCQDASPCSRVR